MSNRRPSKGRAEAEGVPLPPKGRHDLAAAHGCPPTPTVAKLLSDYGLGPKDKKGLAHVLEQLLLEALEKK